MRDGAFFITRERLWRRTTNPDVEKQTRSVLRGRKTQAHRQGRPKLFLTLKPQEVKTAS